MEEVRVLKTERSETMRRLYREGKRPLVIGYDGDEVVIRVEDRVETRKNAAQVDPPLEAS